MEGDEEQYDDRDDELNDVRGSVLVTLGIQ